MSSECSTIPSCSFYQPTLNRTFYVQSKDHDVAQTSAQREIGGPQFVGRSRVVRLIDVSTIFRVARFDIAFKWRSLARKISTRPTRIAILSCLVSDSPGTDSLEYSLVDRPQARQLARQEYSVFSQDHSVFSLDCSESSRTAAVAEAPGDTSRKKNPRDKIKSFDSKVLRGG